MSVAPAPNLSGGVFVTGDCCTGIEFGDTGNRTIDASWNGPPICEYSATCQNGGLNGGDPCDGGGVFPVGGPGTGGSCGDKTVAAFGSSVSSLKPLPGCIICTGTEIITPCGCAKIPYLPGPMPVGPIYAPFPIVIGGPIPLTPPALPQPPVGVLTPLAVISGTPWWIQVEVYDKVSAYVVYDMPVTCVQTGVTQMATNCEQAFEEFTYWVPQAPPAEFTFTCPGGVGTACGDFPTQYTYAGTSVDAETYSSIKLELTQV